MFPDSDMDVLVEAAFGADLTASPDTWQFTNLSDRLLANPVTIRRGCTAGGANQQITTATGLQLTNEDGWLTPHHAGSDWWPYVDAGTPIRFAVRPDPDPVYTDSFSRSFSGGWSAADSAHTYVHGGGTTSSFTINGSVGQMSVPGVATTRRAVSSHNVPDADVQFDVSVPVMASGAALSAGTIMRYVDGSNNVFAAVDFLVGGGVEVKARTMVASAFTTIGQATVAGLTYTPGAAIRCRVLLQGNVLRMRAWAAAGVEPTDWPLQVTQTTYTATGRIGFQSFVPSGSTNTLPVVFSFDNIAVRSVHTPRVEGYITDVRPAFEPLAGGTTWSTVTVDIGGVGSRLEKREAPAFSPMRRAIQASVTPYVAGAPIAYWPLEDAEGALSAASAYPGVAAMTVTGPAVFSFDQGTPDDLYLSRYGTKPLVSVAAGARLTGVVPISSVASEWSVTVTAQLYVPDVPATTEIRVLEWATPTSTIARWALVATATGYQVRAYNDTAGTVTNVVTTATVFTPLVVYEVDAVQNGANIDITLWGNSSSLATASVAGTLAPVSRVNVNPDRANTTAAVTTRGLRFITGHIRVYDDVTPVGVPFYYDTEQTASAPGVLVWAYGAWFQEAAHRRVERLCAEEKVRCEIVGDPYSTGITVLNAQRDGAFGDLVSQAAESESGGMLYEWAFGYRYLARSQRYNQDPALTIDMGTYKRSGDTEQTEVLVPELESRAANYWTIRRHLGSEGSAAADSAFRARRGTIAEERTLDVLTDDVLNDHAVWRVHTSTAGRDAHYPSIPLDLAANPDYIDAWLDCQPGSRVLRTNQPTIAGINTIDQVVEGIAETVGPRVWNAVMDGSPGAVWDVWTPGDAVLGWVNPPTSTLQGAITTTATTLLVTTLSAVDWTTDPAAYPIDMELAGERVTFTQAPTGAGPVYTFANVVRSVNGLVKEHVSGTPVELWTKTVVGL